MLSLMVGNWFKQRDRLCNCSQPLQAVQWGRHSYRWLFYVVFGFFHFPIITDCIESVEQLP